MKKLFALCLFTVAFAADSSDAQGAGAGGVWLGDGFVQAPAQAPETDSVECADPKPGVRLNLYLEGGVFDELRDALGDEYFTKRYSDPNYNRNHGLGVDFMNLANHLEAVQGHGYFGLVYSVFLSKISEFSKQVSIATQEQKAAVRQGLSDFLKIISDYKEEALPGEEGHLDKLTYVLVTKFALKIIVDTIKAIDSSK